MTPGPYERMIEGRIASRTCSRREWHALRRFRSARARGIVFPDVALVGPVILSEWERAARSLVPTLNRIAAACRPADGR